MRRFSFKLAAVIAVALFTASVPAAVPSAVEQGVGPSFTSIGPLAFGPDGTLYAGDTSAAAIVAIELGAAASAGEPGSAAVAGIDQKIAAVLGTAAAGIAITDLAVHPRTRQSYISVMRGTGATARPALLKLDGAGALSLVAMDAMRFSKIALPNAPEAAPASGRSNRSQSIMDLAVVSGRVFVAGLSNEEFASKLWSIAYPFTNADRGTSIEIFHGNHGRLETRSPIFSFVPYTVGGQPTLIAGYLCTPLVKIPVDALTPGAKVLGTTIAELGAGNRPIDMILYKKDGRDFLLMSNTSRGVMKIPTATFATEAPITSPVPTGTAGVKYETITAMTGVEQLDLLDPTRSIVIVRNADGTRSLQIVILP
jgi:hypothetical protein